MIKKKMAESKGRIEVGNREKENNNGYNLKRRRRIKVMELK